MRLVILLTVLGLAITLAVSFEPPPAPSGFVTDRAGFISADVQRELDARLERFHRERGPQVVVWIDRDLEGVSLEEWAAKTFEAWGLGRKGKDNGVGLFIFADVRKVRIEVGYGLEDVLTDAVTARLIREQFVPRALAGDPDGAVSNLVDAMLRTLGDVGPSPATELPPLPLWQLVLYLLAAAAMLVLLATHPRLAFFLLLSVVNRGHRDSRRSMGGFQGGGGRSGGGGASGAW